MKHLLRFSALMIMLVLVSTVSHASYEDDVKLIIKGRSTEFDPAPMIVNDRTMLPIRFVSESLGFDVGWNGKTREVTLKKGDKKIILKIGSNKAKVSGVNKVVTLDTAPFIKKDRTFVPLRFISETFGESVDWDGKNRTVIIGSYFKATKVNKTDKVYKSEKNGFTLTIPKDIYDKLAIVDEKGGVNFYVKSIYDEFKNGKSEFTGRLFSISKFDNPMTLYFGAMATNLVYKDGYYNAVFVSDVNFDPNDKKEQDHYNEVFRSTHNFLHSFKLSK